MKTTISAVTALTFLLCSAAIAQTSVRDLNPPSKVTGCMGKPLGTRVTIAGALAERTMLVNALTVSEIDGQPVKDAVSLEIRGNLRIQKGVRYRLEGYESGEFSAAPEWVAPAAQQPFQFRSYFVVTKIIEPKSE